MQRLKEKAIRGLILALLLIFAACGNNSHENMHDRMMRGGQMGNGGMMGGGQNTMGDSAVSRQGGMMGGSQGGQQLGASRNFQQNIDDKKAYEFAQEYLQSTGNTAYKIGKSSERDGEFEFPLIRMSDGSRVAGLFVDKKTGKVRSAK